MGRKLNARINGNLSRLKYALFTILERRVVIMEISDTEVTTSVYIVDFPFLVDLQTAFALVPTGSDVGNVMELAVGDLKREVGKDGIETLQNRLDAKYAFPNSVNMKVVVREKVLMVKLCPQRIHVTGVKKRSQCEEVYAYICDILTAIQNDLQAIRAGTVGGDEGVNEASEALTRLATRRQIPESDFEAFCEWVVSSASDIVTFPPDPVPGSGVTYPVMINKHYKFPVTFDLDKLAKELEKLFLIDYEMNKHAIESGEAFALNVTYNNAVQKSVLVWVPDLRLPGHVRGSREKLRKEPIHRIFINRTGSMTQMGPDELSMNAVFAHFAKLLERTTYAKSLSASSCAV